MNQNYNYDCSYIKYLISMKYVEAMQRREECTTLSKGKPYNFAHQLYVVGTKVLACRNILIPTRINTTDSRDNTKGVFMGTLWKHHSDK